MVQYLDNYSFRRQLIAALKAKDIEDSSHYDIGSRISIETAHSSVHPNQSMARSSKWMIEVEPKGTTGQIRTNRQVTQPIQKMSSNTRKIPETTGKQPSKEGKLKYYECGQKGHMRPECPKLRS